MKPVLFFLFLLQITNNIKAEECMRLKAAFEREEAAYDTVARIAVAGNSAHQIIGRFVDSGERVLTECPKAYSLDRQYTLKRKLKTAKEIRPSYKVMTQSELKEYARSHPEKVIIYKWGTIRPMP